ncbi:MAG TPA: methyltransferase domain-containing protein [Coxiellaceae bacterium]|nr:methyltransferase domain-containing protein [Coxiellaceae bacterium]
MRHFIAFLKGLALNPRSIGAVFPSSGELANAMAACISKPTQNYVLELGPGTGVITQAILKAGIPAEKLISLELAPHFADPLRTQFPTVTIIEGNATNLSELMQGKTIDTIISSLPLRSIPKIEREKILSEVEKVLAPHGQFIQFTYALFDNHQFDPKNTALTKTFIVWKNIPPARVSVRQKID